MADQAVPAMASVIEQELAWITDVLPVPDAMPQRDEPAGSMKPDDDDEEDDQNDARLSPLELRRKRNRESMARARKRHRDELAQMRATLQALERQHSELQASRNARRATAVHEMMATQSPRTQALYHEYCELASMALVLKDEKYRLQTALAEQEDSHRRMDQVLADHADEFQGSQSPQWLAVDYNFTPITQQHADALVRQWYQRSEQLRAAARPCVIQADAVRAESFGWTTNSHVVSDSDLLFVLFQKQFPATSAHALMEKTWQLYGQPEYNTSAFRRIVHLHTLQELGNNMRVMVRDVEHPFDRTRVLRTIYLRFRMMVEGGYMIGRACMNPTNPTQRRLDEQDGNFEYADVGLTVRFQDVDGGCSLSVGTLGGSPTQQHDMALRLLNLLFGTLLWENNMIAPIVDVVPSSDEP